MRSLWMTNKLGAIVKGVAVCGALMVGGVDGVAFGADDYVIEGGEIKAKGQVAKDSAEAGLDRIRRLLSKNRKLSRDTLRDYRDARVLAGQWIEKYPNHLRLAEAYLLRGEAKVRRGDIYDALYDFEVVATRFSNTEYFGEALEAEFRVADYFGTQGKKRRSMFFRMIPADEEAVEIWIRIQERAPDSVLGEQASLALAHYFARESMIDEAVIAYEAFLLNYPRSKERERITLELIKSHMARFKGPEFDQSGLLEALVRLGDYRVAFPGSEVLKGAERGIREALAEKGRTDALWYEKRGKRVSAIYMYRRLLKDFGDTRAGARARMRLEKMGVGLGLKNNRGNKKSEKVAVAGDNKGARR